MKKFIIFTSLWFCLTGLLSAQQSRSNVIYGGKGLAITEEILAEMDLPSWCWGGAHVLDNVTQNYRLITGACAEVTIITASTLPSINICTESSGLESTMLTSLEESP